MKDLKIGDYVENKKIFTKNGIVWTKGSWFIVTHLYDDGCILHPAMLVATDDNKHVDAEVPVCISNYKTFSKLYGVAC